MHSQFPQQRRRFARRGFTMIEMLVVLAIVVILFSLAFRVLSASMENARTEATRATIRHLDSALQDRLEDFERINFKPLATRFKAIYDGYNPGADLPMEVAILMVKKDRFRGSFPQREEDMYGFDGTLGGGITGDEAPLLMSMWNPSSSAWKPDSWAAKNSAVTGELAEAAESSELLYVALKNGSIFGPPHPGLDRIPSRHIGDTDNDGNLEFLDDWGHPLRFYNWSTRLFRPGGPGPNPGEPGASIDQMMFRSTVGVLAPDVIPAQSSDPMVPTGPLLPTDFSHPLNQDPDDVTGALSAVLTTPPKYLATVFNNGTPYPGMKFDEAFYHIPDTFSIPLIVSAGPDGRLGMFEPTGFDPRNGTTTSTLRLARPFAEDINSNGVLDSGEDLNGDGVIESPDALYDDITNRQL